MSHADRESANTPRWIIAVGLTLAVLMDALNGTIFTIARPQIIGDAAATPDEAAWVNLGYLMAKLSGFLAAAWVVDRFGEIRTFGVSLFLVLASSLVCALTLDLFAVIAARIVQGAAGAGLLVASQTLIFRLFPRSRQGLAQALFALGVVMAPTTLAPAVQGWLVDDISWIAVFWLNLALAPIVLFCLLPCRRTLPKARQIRRPFDAIGFTLLAVALAALVYVLLEGPRWNWFEEARITFWAVAGGAALMLATGRMISGDGRAGCFDRSVFTAAPFAFGFLVSFVAGFALFGSAFLIPVHALNVLAMTPREAGMLLLPSSLAVGAGLLIAGGGIAARKLHPLAFVPVGIALVMLAMWMLSRSGIDSGAHDLWGGLLLRGLGLGLLFLAVTLVTLNDLKRSRIASGVGLFNLGRQMGGIIGVSFLNSYLDRQIALNRRVLIENIDPANPPFQESQAFLAEALIARGLDPGQAAEGAAMIIANGLQAQVAVLSFNEAFYALMLLFVFAVPLIAAFKLAQKRRGWVH